MQTRFLGARAVAVLFFAPLLAFLPGCLNDESSPEEDTLNEAENGVSASLSETALELDQALLASVPAWMTDGVEAPGLRDGTTAYDEESQSWVITFSEDYAEDDATGHLESTHRIQFLESGAPVQFPSENTNQLDVTVEGTNAGNYHPDDRWNVDYDLDFQRQLTAVRNEDGSLSIDGAGSIGGATTYHVGNRIFPRQTTLEWSSALSFAAQSTCPAGTIDGSNGRCDFHASFDGAGTVTWSVTRNGSIVRSGTDLHECALPPPAE
jgi:hypothetical protein